MRVGEEGKGRGSEGGNENEKQCIVLTIFQLCEFLYTFLFPAFFHLYIF